MYAKLWVESPERVSALAVRESWIDWAQSREFKDRVEAYRDQARKERWGMGPSNAPLAPQYIAHLVEYCAYRAAGRCDIDWPTERCPEVVELVRQGTPLLRPFNQLHWEMLSWGVVTMAAFGLRHDECEGLSISDIKAPVGAAWQLRILPASGRTKTGVPGEPQWVPLPQVLLGLPFIDLLHRDAQRWHRPVRTARFLFWLVVRSLVRWRSDGRRWLERLKRHNALGSFLAEYTGELRGVALFPAWEKSVCRAVVASLVAPCGWAREDLDSGKRYGYAVHGGRSAMATLLYCAYGTPAPVVADMARWAGKAAGGYIHPRHPAAK
eukprot:gene777-1441_t